MKGKNLVPPLFARGTFGGVPSHFRGWCMTASMGGSTGGYRWVGRRFGEGLLSYAPHDLETDEWLTVVGQMIDRCLPEQAPIDREALGTWLRRHFPLMMRLVPTDRFDRFLDGVVEAYDEGEMIEDFPAEFEPVEVDLDDPCGGTGYIRAIYYRPFLREVVYQCPAPACRESSRVAVEHYGADNGLPIVEAGGIIATLRDLSQVRTPTEK